MTGAIWMRTSLEEGIKLHRFAGIFPEQFSTEAGRHREAVVTADQRMVIRCFRDDLAHFVHDVSHVAPPIQRTGLVDAPFWRHHEGRDRQSDAAEHLKGMAKLAMPWSRICRSSSDSMTIIVSVTDRKFRYCSRKMISSVIVIAIFSRA